MKRRSFLSRALALAMAPVAACFGVPNKAAVHCIDEIAAKKKAFREAGAASKSWKVTVAWGTHSPDNPRALKTGGSTSTEFDIEVPAGIDIRAFLTK